MPYIDFATLKEAVTIEQAAEYLGLQLKVSNKQLRGPCPACQSGGDRILAITPAKQLFYCFASEQGGDCIKLVAHIRGIKQQDAAAELAAHFLRTVPSTVPRSHQAKEQFPQFDPAAYAETLDPEHPSVEAVGFDSSTAKALGIGHSSKGLLRGLVAVPLRLPDGTTVCYMGVTEVKLPENIKLPQPTNVVPLKRA